MLIWFVVLYLLVSIGIGLFAATRVHSAKDFAVELQTADPQRPLLSFPMSRRAAETWCARLNAIFNG